MKHSSLLITGCSSGIGWQAATQLKQRGYRIFATARKAADVEKLKSQGFESVRLDVADSHSIQQALEEVLALTGGTLGAVFNNAGYLQAGAVEDMTRDMNRAQFETNVFGPMELIRQILPVMRKQGYGRIIQNSSILGIVALPYCGAYNASKFALEGFSNTLRQELRGTSIYVSILNPGPVYSKLREHGYDYYQHHASELQNSVHQEAYKKLEAFYFQRKKEDKLTSHPDVVVKKLIHALESTHPRAHYYVGFISQTLSILRRLLPDVVLDKILCAARQF